MEHKAFNLILLGDPASGKGTQSEYLIKKHHFYDLDMGREVRKPAVRERFDFAKTTGIGKLTPTAIVRDIFKKMIIGVPEQQGILFNGTPKMINEAKLVARLLKHGKRSDPLVIYLSIPEKEVVQRAGKRVVVIDGKKVRRDDDTLRALANRRRYYKEQISRVMVFFGEKYTVKKISGVGSRAEVRAKINAAIDAYIKK
jgi:adenylate kinase